MTEQTRRHIEMLAAAHKQIHDPAPRPLWAGSQYVKVPTADGSSWAYVLAADLR
jgi:hypothetical protein